MITFRQINRYSEIVEETELYQLHHNPEARFMYDYNFLQFKRVPMIEDFQEAEKRLLAFHSQHKMKHVKFLWPEREHIAEQLIDYLKKRHYHTNISELFIIRPAEFKAGVGNKKASVTLVNKENLQELLSMKYEQDTKHGQEFATQKSEWYKKLFLSDKTIQVMAYLNNKPAGAVDMVQCHDTIELDHFFVIPPYRNQGIGVEIQKFVMDYAEEKTVILVADGKATPRTMYLKQNYCYSGFQLDAQKMIA